MTDRTTRDTRPDTKPVAIAGGGLAGLSALTYLARAGVPAILFERSGALGGRARTDSTSGYSLNLGGHALYRRGAGMRVLDELGVPVPGKMPPAAGAYAIDRGVLHTMPAGLVSLLSTNLMKLPAKLELARLFARLRSMSPADMPRGSMEEWMAANIRDSDVARFIRALVRVTTYVADARVIAARSALTQMRLGLFGNVLYVDGGWQVLVEGLRRAAIEAGGRIVTGKRVRAIEHDTEVRAVVLDDGERIEVSGAILATPPKAAAELVEGRAKDELLAAANAATPVLAACLDVALRRLPVPRARFALGVDRPLYFSVHSGTAKLAPGDGAVIHLMKYLAPDDRAGAGENERELEALMDLLQPGWKQELVERRFLPEMTVVHAVVPPGAAERHGARVEAVSNLCVAGDWVGAESHLADASLASGKAAALAIEESARRATSKAAA